MNKSTIFVKVYRQKTWKEISVTELLPGDMLSLYKGEGDMTGRNSQKSAPERFGIGKIPVHSRLRISLSAMRRAPAARQYGRQ